MNESLNAIAYGGAVDTFPGAATRFLRFRGVTYRPLVDATFSTLALATRRGDRRTAVTAFRQVSKHLVSTSLDLVPQAVAIGKEPID